jgi:hypothetical protein
MKSTNTDNFSYVHDEYENCNFCSQKYKGYSVFEYQDTAEIDVEFCPKKMNELGIVVDAKYALTHFEAKHPKAIKDNGIPDDIQSYVNYLKSENSLYDKDKKRILADINKKATAKKRGIFSLKAIPASKDYLDQCIIKKQDRIFLGVRINLKEISVARINKDAPHGMGIDNYKNIRDIDEQTRKIITSLKPEHIHHILTAYHTQESFDEGDVEGFLTGMKDLIEEVDEAVHFKDADFAKLLGRVARLCFMWREKQSASTEFLKEANDFILLRRNSTLNPVIEFAGAFFDDLISDAIAQNQIIECQHCHLLASYFRNKKFCSKATDGRNCFGKHHSKQDYQRHKGKRLPVKRAWIKKARREIPGY